MKNSNPAMCAGKMPEVKTSNLFYKTKTYLTYREKEYLTLVSLGYSNEDIAESLYTTRATVKKTLQAIYDKLSAKNRANAVLIARVSGILDDITIRKIAGKYSLETKLANISLNYEIDI